MLWRDRSSRSVRFALYAAQIGAQIGGGLIAHRAIFFERLVDDAFELGRHRGIQTDGGERERDSELLRKSRRKSSRKKPLCRWPFRREQRRKRRDRCGDRVGRRELALATCR